jgi:hypothetical protein
MSTNAMSRRHLLASVPAMAAVSVPAVATAFGGLPAGGDDPVFAAIEAHKQAMEAASAAYRTHAHLEDTLPAAQRSWSWSVWERDPPKAAPTHRSGSRRRWLWMLPRTVTTMQCLIS